MTVKRRIRLAALRRTWRPKPLRPVRVQRYSVDQLQRPQADAKGWQFESLGRRHGGVVRAMAHRRSRNISRPRHTCVRGQPANRRHSLSHQGKNRTPRSSIRGYAAAKINESVSVRLMPIEWRAGEGPEAYRRPRFREAELLEIYVVALRRREKPSLARAAASGGGGGGGAPS